MIKITIHQIRIFEHGLQVSGIKNKTKKTQKDRWLQCAGIFENECPSSHCYSKFGPPTTSNICVTWELIRIADPQAAPSVYWVRICIVTKLQVNSAQMKSSGTTVKPLVQHGLSLRRNTRTIPYFAAQGKHAFSPPPPLYLTANTARGGNAGLILEKLGNLSPVLEYLKLKSIVC